jgi:hypothetical protein
VLSRDAKFSPISQRLHLDFTTFREHAAGAVMARRRRARDDQRRRPVMSRFVFALALFATAVPACAQDAIPDLKGTWTGKGKSVVFGANSYHPGSQTANDAPRVRDIEATYVVEGQEGRVAWGHSSSTNADTKEPFSWAIAGDNKTIIGADIDGYFHIVVVSPDRIDKCYTQNSASPSKAIVAACYAMDRVKR